MASLKLFPEGTAIVEPNTVMRFLERAPGQHEGITLEEGIIEIDSQLDLDVHTARAIARLSKGTRLRIRAQGSEAIRFDVLVGQVTVERDGNSETLRQGAVLDLDHPTAAPEPKVETAPEPAAAEPPTSRDPGVPTHADFAMAGLETATIHVATPPVDVRIGLPPCSTGQPALELVGSGEHKLLSPASGTDSVLVRLPAGPHRLRLRCGKQLSRENSLRVQRDPATMELPKTVPHVAVEADGRRYTVRYQNVLPAVSFAWPSAPGATRYALELSRGGRVQRFELDRPQYELRSGELEEGDHQFSFSTATGQHSATGNLRIVFDNTARSAYLSAPAEGGGGDGSNVTVAGAALLRSEVSVFGTPIPLDAQGRFRTAAPSDPSQGALAVRVSHPVTGVHYYLRRLR